MRPRARATELIDVLPSALCRNSTTVAAPARITRQRQITSRRRRRCLMHAPPRFRCISRPRMIDDRGTVAAATATRKTQEPLSRDSQPSLPPFGRARLSALRNMHFFPVVCTPSTVMRLHSHRQDPQRRSTLLPAPPRARFDLLALQSHRQFDQPEFPGFAATRPRRCSSAIAHSKPRGVLDFVAPRATEITFN